MPYFVNPRLSYVFQGPKQRYPALSGRPPRLQMARSADSCRPVVHGSGRDQGKDEDRSLRLPSKPASGDRCIVMAWIAMFMAVSTGWLDRRHLRWEGSIGGVTTGSAWAPCLKRTRDEQRRSARDLTLRGQAACAGFDLLSKTGRAYDARKTDSEGR